MTESRPNDEAIFHAARDIADPDRRRAYVREACGGDETLIAHIEALLAVANSPDSLLDHPPIGLVEDGDTRTEPSAGDADEGLHFLEASDKPGSIGRLGHYEVQEVVGRGGMGVVLRALDEKLHRVVAIKVMAPQLATSATARKRFIREARAAAAVTHDHVVTIHAVEDAGPVPYIVMQFVSGVSLQDRLDRTGPLPLPEILRIGMQTAAGLAAAHAQGQVHRDVKPANILLENGVERVKLTDFGLVRVADDASLTQSGTVAGTPSFMSPEQAEGKSVDHRSDLFSLGSVLYAMCTGRPPFRASTSMGVLKRVCEETPKPIRETNPEVPHWLVAAVERLHAKDPAARFQSAAEVAELLGRNLAHVQHPSVVPLPAVVTSAEPTPASARPERRKRWAVAAAVLVAMLAVLGASEATGVTNVRASVIRIFTPEGTLVVETDDPAVKVTVEGDGDLVITGAGAQEVRLRAGSYRLQATRDGKPVKLDRDLVTITRGDRQIVRVRMEGDVPAAAAPKAEPGAFVVLGGKGIPDRKFDTLAEAVLGASDGDTIEVRGNGPFLTPPLHLGKTALNIRAGGGFRPVIRLSPEWAEQNVHLLHTQAALVLEGLELHRVRPGWDEKSYHHIIESMGAPVRAANCRFVLKPTHFAVQAIDSPVLDLRNCEFLLGTGGNPVNNDAVAWIAPAGGRFRMQNCLTAGQFGLRLGSGSYPPKPASVVLAGNTLVARLAPVLLFLDPTQEPPGGGAAGGFSVEASTNVLDGGNVCLNSYYVNPGDPPPTEADFLRRSLNWKGDRNQFSLGSGFTAWSYPPGTSADGIKDLTEWNRFWKQENSGCGSGKVRYRGGDILSRSDKTPEQLAPEDFRLHPDSAGYRAGKDGKDLGADVDLVGPGPAYERWKKTPAYQQWLKDTGQLRAEAPKSEPGAFVLLAAGKERKFDTLAQAVQAASSGDTIEIRGNGPFTIDSVSLGKAALTIRAAHGFRPVLKPSVDVVEKGVPLLETAAPLVLEGLTLGQFTPKTRPGGAHSMLVSHEAPLWIANCRFFMKDQWQICVNAFHCPTVDLRNCEFLITTGTGLSWAVRESSRCLVSNCVQAGGQFVGVGSYRRGARGASAHLERNTLASTLWLVGLGVGGQSSPNFWGLGPEDKLVRIKAADNILDAPWALGFVQNPDWVPNELWTAVKGAEGEAAFRTMLDWEDERNVFAPGSAAVHWRISDVAEAPHGPKAISDWKKFWGNPKADATEGPVRYQGGNLLAKLAAGPDKLTPEDFRLRSDSAGYKAGKDKKDLGADVDLVGPGAAYERWQKTPGYQQWLKETGQLKK